MSVENLYKRLRALEPAPVIQTGVIDDFFLDGTASVVLDGAGLIVALNPLGLAEGQAVFVSNREIKGIAPSLPYIYLEI